jgi:hypothetical protein
MSIEIWAPPSVWTGPYIWEIPSSLEQNFADLNYILKFCIKANEEGFKLRIYGNDYKPRWGNFYFEGPNKLWRTECSWIVSKLKFNTNSAHVMLVLICFYAGTDKELWFYCKLQSEQMCRKSIFNFRETTDRFSFFWVVKLKRLSFRNTTKTAPVI